MTNRLIPMAKIQNSPSIRKKTHTKIDKRQKLVQEGSNHSSPYDQLEEEHLPSKIMQLLTFTFDLIKLYWEGKRTGRELFYSGAGRKKRTDSSSSTMGSQEITSKIKFGKCNTNVTFKDMEMNIKIIMQKK